MENTIINKPAISIQGLFKSFGRNLVLRDINLDIYHGERITIFGPNGAGKSTLIKILAMLTKPDFGQINILGYNLESKPQNIRQLIGVVTHKTFLYEDLTGYENLAFYAKMFGLNNIRERIDAVTSKMGIQFRVDRKIGTLSHGMKKRFSIARSLLHDPLILLLDEPDGGLDQHALAMLDTLVVNSEGIPRTILLTTHNLDIGINFSNKIGIISNNSIIYLNTTKNMDLNTFKQIYIEHTGFEV